MPNAALLLSVSDFFELMIGPISLGEILLLLLILIVGYVLRKRISWSIRKALISVFGRLSRSAPALLNLMDMPIRIAVMIGALQVCTLLFPWDSLFTQLADDGTTIADTLSISSLQALLNGVFATLYLFCASLYVFLMLRRTTRDKSDLAELNNYKVLARTIRVLGHILELALLIGTLVLATQILGLGYLKELGKYLGEALNFRIGDVRLWRYLIIISMIALGILLKKLCSDVVVKILKNITSRTVSEVDDSIVAALEKPVQALSIAVGSHLAFLFIPWRVFFYSGFDSQGSKIGDTQIILTITRIGAQVFTVVYVWIATMFLLKLIDNLTVLGVERAKKKDKTKFDSTFLITVRRFVKVIVVMFAIAMSLDLFGVDVKLIVASFSVASAAVAFAARDAIANVFGAIVLSSDRPFSLGDWVVIDNVEGTVEEIGLRSTQIRTFAKSLVSIPNNKLMNLNIENMSARPRQRIKAFFGITYDSPPEKVEQLIEGIKKIIINNPTTYKDYYHVWFTEFAESSLTIMLYFFIESTEWAVFLENRQKIYLEIMRLVKSLDLEFAFPTQTIFLHDESKNA